MIVKTDCETDGSYAALLLLTCSVSVVPADRRVKYVYLPVELWMNTDRKMSPSLDLKRGRKQAARWPSVPLLRAGGGLAKARCWPQPRLAASVSTVAQSVSASSVQQIPASLGPASSGQPGPSPGTSNIHQGPAPVMKAYMSLLIIVILTKGNQL